MAENVDPLAVILGAVNPAAGFVLSLLTSTKGAYDQSQARKDALAEQAEIARQNKVLADMQANDALERGVLAGQGHRRQVNQLKESQIASMAARGLDLGGGSAADVMASPDIVAQYDSKTIGDNAEKEAEGYRMMGKNYKANASLLSSRAGRENPLLNGFSSLLTEAPKVAEYWYGN